MYCRKCGHTKLEIGIAIDPKYEEGRYFAPYIKILKAEEVKSIHCYKCPKCGWSDDGDRHYLNP